MNRVIKLKRVAVGASLVSIIIAAPLAMAERDSNVSNGPYQNYRHNQHHNSRGGCTPYQLSAFGGEAGFRLMNNVNNFHRTADGSITGRICSGGRVTVELSKRHPNTHVALELNGREYIFGRGDRGQRLTNHWYRRYIQVELFHRPRHGEEFKNHGRGFQANEDRYRGHGFSDDYNNAVSQHDDRHGHDQRSFNHSYYNTRNNRHNHSMPHLRVGTKKHHKAHRKGITHRHLKDHYAYH